jgi:hypothetical protein
MKEELNEKMHNEFSVDENTDLKHRVWTMMDEARRRDVTPEELLESYGLTDHDLAKHRDSYLALNK